jgi:hypothetical protein
MSELTPLLQKQSTFSLKVARCVTSNSAIMSVPVRSRSHWQSEMSADVWRLRRSRQHL